MNVLVLSGSNVGEHTEQATKTLYDLLQAEHSDLDLHYLSLRHKDLMFADGRNYLDYPGDTGEVARAMMAADIIFIGTPIFQASIPAVLKNVFDLLPQKALEYKTVGIMANAGSNRHFLIPEQQLKPILGYMKANVVPRYVYLNDRDFGLSGIESDDVLFRLRDLMEDTLVLAEAYQLVWQKEQERYGF